MSDAIGKMLTVPLGEGFYMVRHITEPMANMVWNFLDDNQRNELYALYGDDPDVARRMMWEEIKASDHAAAFYDCTTLVCAMWAGWVPVKNKGRMRTLGCFCNTRYAKRLTRKFIKFTPICRDAFEIEEPHGVDELFVFIAKDFASSRAWAVKIAGFEESFPAVANGHEFVCYSRKIGGCNV